mmetsp:Transcript_26439/g.33652  ORF Transcript_26439/g.33652 Transcript_26439/m.33652 type:complete len:81 (+) Transcript_26439:1084-1326(+)
MVPNTANGRENGACVTSPNSKSRKQRKSPSICDIDLPLLPCLKKEIETKHNHAKTQKRNIERQRHPNQSQRSQKRLKFFC